MKRTRDAYWAEVKKIQQAQGVDILKARHILSGKNGTGGAVTAHRSRTPRAVVEEALSQIKSLEFEVQSFETKLTTLNEELKQWRKIAGSLEPEAVAMAVE